VRAVFNSKKANVIVRRLTARQPGKVKIVFTLKPKHFSGNGAGFLRKTFDKNFQKLLAKLCNMHMTSFVKNWFSVSERAQAKRA